MLMKKLPTQYKGITAREALKYFFIDVSPRMGRKSVMALLYRGYYVSPCNASTMETLQKSYSTVYAVRLFKDGVVTYLECSCAIWKKFWICQSFCDVYNTKIKEFVC